MMCCKHYTCKYDVNGVVFGGEVLSDFLKIKKKQKQGKEI